MKVTKLSICLAFAFLSGCGTAPPISPSIAFNYKTTNAAGVGIVQVFEMGGNTVVQIKNLQDKAPLFLAEGNTELKYQMMGETAVLPGIVKSFTVVSSGAWAQVTRQTGMEAATAAGKLPPTAPITGKGLASDEEIRAQIAAMKAEIARLKASIGQPTPDPTAAGIPTTPAVKEPKRPNYAPISSVKESTTLRVAFKNNSSDFEPRAAMARKLLDLAEQATEISVTGYTDSAQQNPASTALAKGRAISARQYLISNGIDKSKISVAYKASGGFVADNSTREGRDENRRVEIELL
jgi:outer membrane protein OmpA-like peptidoglycan-associated protein